MSNRAFVRWTVKQASWVRSPQQTIRFLFDRSSLQGNGKPVSSILAKRTSLSGRSEPPLNLRTHIPMTASTLTSRVYWERSPTLESDYGTRDGDVNKKDLPGLGLISTWLATTESGVAYTFLDCLYHACFFRLKVFRCEKRLLLKTFLTASRLSFHPLHTDS